MTKRSRRGHGEGSIYQRSSDGRWVGALHVGWEAGKRRRKVVYGDTQAEVIAQLDELKRRRDEGSLPRVDGETVGEFLTNWVDRHLPGTVADTTVDSYRYIVGSHIAPTIGSQRLDRLRPQDVQALLNVKRDEGYSPRTREYIHSVLRRGLGLAEKWGLVGRNVASLVETPRIPKRKVNPFDEPELRRILIAAEAERLYALFVVAVTTGLRLGEVVGLLWEHVDLHARVLRVEQTRRRTGTVAEPKTQAGVRAVPLPPVAAETLVAHREDQEREAKQAGDGWQETGYVFTTEEGRPLGHRFVQRVWYRVLRRAGVKQRGFHHLRKTYTSLLAERGVHPKTAQELLGHADIRTTMEAYTKVNEAMLRKAADEINDVVGGLDEGRPSPGAPGRDDG